MTYGKLAIRLIPSSLAIVGKNESLNFKTAQRFAQKLLCEKNTVCGSCGPCVRVIKNTSESVLVIKPENESIKIEKAKEIMNFIKLAPINKANIVIIKNAHLMNKETANHLLKAIEEPTIYQYFMLLAPAEGTLLPTIKSRVQVFRSTKTNSDLKDDNEKSNLENPSFEKAINMLDAIMKNSIIDVGKIKIKDKKESLEICYFLREFLRDLAITNYNQTLLKYPDVIKRYNSIKLDRVNKLFTFSAKMVQYLQGNIDRNMTFEQMALLEISNDT